MQSWLRACVRGGRPKAGQAMRFRKPACLAPHAKTASHPSSSAQRAGATHIMYSPRLVCKAELRNCRHRFLTILLAHLPSPISPSRRMCTQTTSVEQKRGGCCRRTRIALQAPIASSLSSFQVTPRTRLITISVVYISPTPLADALWLSLFHISILLYRIHISAIVHLVQPKRHDTVITPQKFSSDAVANHRWSSLSKLLGRREVTL